MHQRPHRLRSSLGLIAAALLAASCSGQVASGPTPDAAAQDTSQTSDFPPGSEGIKPPPGALTISPADQQLTIEPGKSFPTVQYVAKRGGEVVTANWQVDRGEIGTISAAGLFTPAGIAGGRAVITAQFGSEQAKTSVKVKLVMGQNGFNSGNGNPGPGGFGGVGGEGLGPAVSTQLKTLLDGAPTADASMKMLYPYDKTVWPLGLLAPLLQWSPTAAGKGEAVRISLTSDHFSYVGYFGRPAALGAGANLVRHPLPQNVWKAATRSAAGGKLELEILVAEGGKVYGPLKQSWTIARGALRGTVYYQSYGTNLVKNYDGAFGGGRFGGATLAIKGGSADPVLVAGANGSSSACRVCHSVAANGSRMVVQHGNDYQVSSSYDLLAGYKETAYPASTRGKLGWVGLSPDGSLGLGNAVPIPGGANAGAVTALYDMNTGAAINAPGLSSFVTKAGFPMFSAKGTMVAFNFHAGPGDATIGPGDGSQLVVMDFDATSKTFSNPRGLYKTSAGQRPGWPAFWPTDQAAVFQIELPGASEYFATRNGGRGELWWVDIATRTAHPLHALNGQTSAGVSYLPSAPNGHDKDHQLNYEPTVSPIASGGYAWVVLTSRRLYGNVATINPWHSDPRDHDLRTTPTPKKLWVAALNLNPKPGTDPSHPAFYLPGQELLAGNTRGFWVADPCKADGASCEAGDECCGGFCSQQSGSGKLVCGQAKPGCAAEFDKCEKDADCCDTPTFKCVNGKCARWTIN